MEDVETLASRLDAALNRLEAQGTGSGANADADADARVATLESQNRELETALSALTAERQKDLAQLDDLIAQLRPLIEETA